MCRAISRVQDDILGADMTIRGMISDYIDKKEDRFFLKFEEGLKAYTSSQNQNFEVIKESIESLDTDRVDDCGRPTNYYKFTESFAKERYERELSRERNIVEQAAHMQTAYSILLVALMSSIGPVTQYRGNVDLLIFLKGYIAIGILLAIGLLCITKAQQLYRHVELTDIDYIKQIIADKENEFESIYSLESQCIAKAGMYINTAKSINDNNNKRVIYYNCSRILFSITVFISIFIAVGGVIYYSNI